MIELVGVKYDEVLLKKYTVFAMLYGDSGGFDDDDGKTGEDLEAGFSVQKRKVRVNTSFHGHVFSRTTGSPLPCL